MNATDSSTLIEILVATGLLTAISEGVRWYFGRGKVKVDQAKVVQGMAIDLLKPLHDEMARAQASADELRIKIEAMEVEMDAVLAWAVVARALLDSNHLTYPPLPARLG